MSTKARKSNQSRNTVSTRNVSRTSGPTNYQGAINGAAAGANLCKNFGPAGLAVGMSAGGVIGYLLDKWRIKDSPREAIFFDHSHQFHVWVTHMIF